MILNLRINQISPAGVDWLSRYLSEVETRNLESAIAFFDDTVQFVGDGSRCIRIFFYDNDIFVFCYELAGYKRAEQASAQNYYFHR